jgi:hypothetical protein
MPASVMRVDGQFAIADQVEFLVLSQAKPRAREIKGGPIHRRQL